MDFSNRTELLINDDGIKKLKKSKVIIFGIGGVGGYVLEMLVRTGIGEIDIVDFDIIDATNINRQIIANHQNIGEFKTKISLKRALSINPNLKINTFNQRVCIENVHQILKKKYHFVVDCIDTVTNKLDLIEYCYKNNLNIISSMGAGNRIGIPQYEITDIYKTQYDKLAKVIRQECKNRDIKKLTVCYTKEQPIRNEKPIGSIAYHPAVCGSVIASYVINELIKNYK